MAIFIVIYFIAGKNKKRTDESSLMVGKFQIINDLKFMIGLFPYGSD